MARKTQTQQWTPNTSDKEHNIFTHQILQTNARLGTFNLQDKTVYLNQKAKAHAAKIHNYIM